MNKIFLLLLSAIIMVSCSNNKTQLTDKKGNTIELNSVETESNENKTLNYSYYLPNAYNGTDSLPVVFMLDPHANGKLPAEKYSAAANKYNYVIIASNNIKNGQSSKESSKLFGSLIKETKSRFVIDENRLFVAGFSGGAKLAIAFAQELPNIIGVAACGGSLPIPPDYTPNFYFAGIVGNQDFNYLEANQTFAVFDQQGFDYTSVVFNGGHEWPPVESFEMALIGFNIYATKLGRIYKDDEWLNNLHTRMIDSINYFEEQGKAVEANIYLRQAARWFYGLRNAQELNLKSATVVRSQEFINQFKKRQKLIQKEVKLRAEFIRAIELKDLDWWNTEVEKINKSIENSDKDVAQVSKRLLNYVSMACFMLTKNALEDSNFDSAFKKLQIYELVDPENFDVYLMNARYNMQNQHYDAMNENFNKAKDLGFTDVETYKAETFWIPLLNNPKLEL